MRKYIEKAEQLSLPVIPLRGVVAFPGVTLNFEITHEVCIKAAEAAFATDSMVLLCATKKFVDDADDITAENLYRVGTVAKIKQSIKTPEGNMRLIAEGYTRATVVEFRSFADYTVADAISKIVMMSDEDSLRNEAYSHAMLGEVEKLVKLLPSVSDDIIMTAKSIKSPALLADFIASNILVRYDDKQKVLECYEPVKRIEILIALLQSETKLLEYELNIQKRVRSNINRNQKEYYLREQIRVIKNELNEDDEDETDEYARKIREAKLPEHIAEKLMKEASRLEKLPFGSSEAAVLRTYLDTCIELPWTVSTKDRVSVSAAKKILDADHDGMEKVKDRILEFLAVKQLNPELRNQIICRVGPPGVGKTSIAESVARAMKRNYVRVSLGGIRDEADIRGHRKTYIGAMPGRIINAISQAKSNNPLILLDEIDKLTRDAHGDPASALLEVLDSEQNKNFRDHFVELPFDLSNCVFIATANTLDTVPRPLLDRMEVIKLRSYTKTEKLAIAKNHLLPKQLRRHGMTKKMLRIDDSAIIEIIDYYTREAGVRNLERTLADVIRKAAKRFVEDSSLTKLTVKSTDVKEYLGERKLLPEHISDRNEVGVVNGLAYTEAGGDLLKVEALILDGEGKIEVTGSLGDVMKESAKIAVSYVRSISSKYGIAPDFYKKHDIHIHFPEGAVPKDGPSAGVTMITAIVSAITGIPVRRDIAMTGEISLRGNVLAIGGLREKTMAAYSAGVSTVLIPADNMRDFEELDTAVKENIRFVPCKTAEDILKNALVPQKAESARKATESEEALPTIIPTVSNASDAVTVIR
ncbi:MAG: endopeptidase La [Clostridia bacterium]|nr:endopeptidase La [Clostridia bacterium]